MSVFVKGMEKPKGNITKADVIFHFEEDASLMSVRESVESIQVVDVPTPHGRLIDADRLKRQVEGRSWKARDKFIELIDNAPTIIEAEEGSEE